MNILHYNGDRSDAVENCSHPMGPDLLGGWWIPTEATYDKEADQTTVRMKPGKFESLVQELAERGTLKLFASPILWT